MLISAMVGMDLRNTLDMDATIKGLEVNEKNLLSILNDIISINLDDDITFEIFNIVNIREEADYSGYRVTLKAYFQTITHAFKIDITTGDIITPRQINYKFDLLFEDRKIDIFAYNLETVISEKFETIISRNVDNTRARDYYDLYIITKLQRANYDEKVLVEAIKNKFEDRKSIDNLKRLEYILEAISNSNELKNIWNSYRKDYSFAEDLEFEDVLESVKEIALLIKDEK